MSASRFSFNEVLLTPLPQNQPRIQVRASRHMRLQRLTALAPNLLETLATLPPGEFIPNRYIVGLKFPEKRDEHVEQLKSQVTDEGLLELKMGTSGKFYSVTLPSEEVLEWLKSRDDVSNVSQDRKARLS